MIGGRDDVEVVLDHDHGVARIAQPAEEAEQPAGVPRVKAGGGLVEHVGDAGEARPELGGQAHALRLAARERRRQSAEGEVPEPGIAQARQAAGDVEPQVGAEEPIAIVNGRAAVVYTGEEREALVHGLRQQFVDVHAADAHRERLGLQAPASACAAGYGCHQRRKGLAAPIGVLALVLEADQFEQARPRRREPVRARPRAAAVLPLDVEHPVAGAVQGDVSGATTERLPRHREIQAQRRTGGGERRHVLSMRIAIETAGLVAIHGAPGQRLRRVGDELRRIALVRVSEAAALRARADLRVRREHGCGQRVGALEPARGAPPSVQPGGAVRAGLVPIRE